MNRLLTFLGPVVAVILWGMIVKLGLVDPFFVPHPVNTFSELLQLIGGGEITRDVLATAIRAVEAFAIAMLAGVPIGLFLGSNERLYRSVEFVIDFFRSTPATAIFPLFLLLFGVGDSSKVAAAAFGASMIVIFNTAYGVMHSKRARILAAKVMGASGWQIFRWVVFWESLPQTFVGLRNAISFSLLIIVVTEMFVGTNVGLGRRVIDSQIIYNISAMYAAIFATGALGYCLNYVLLLVEKRYVHWSTKS